MTTAFMQIGNDKRIPVNVSQNNDADDCTHATLLSADIQEAVQAERERIADWLQKQKDRNITDDASSIFLSLWISAMRQGILE